MKTILQNIQNQLLTEPLFKYVDENWGQLDYYAPAPPVQFPVALITLSQADFINLAKLKQQGILSVEITIAALKLTNSSGKAPDFQKNHAWQIWELVQAAHAKLQGFRPAENAGALIRENFRTIRREDGIQEVRIAYSAGLNGV